MARKSWQEKFDDPRRPEVKTAPKDFADIRAGQRMLLTTPRQLDGFIRQIPPGRSMDMKTLRGMLAVAEGAEIACPVVTGIHLRTIAELVSTRLEHGVPADELTPVWRVIEPGAPVTRKLEHGARTLMAERRREGMSAGG